MSEGSFLDQLPPEEKEFSERKIKRMLAFHREYPQVDFVPQAVAQSDIAQAIFDDHELDEKPTVSQLLTVQKQGKCYLNTILSSAGRKLRGSAGSISHAQAESKAKPEYQKYKAKTLAHVEKDYLKTIATLEKQAKAESRKK